MFYTLVAGALATYIVKVAKDSYSPIVLMFDSALPAKKRSVFLKIIKPRLRSVGVEYRVSFATIKEEACGQIADYFAWSMFRKLEAGDSSQLDGLTVRHDMFDIFQRGHTRYW